jgi:muramidase (phage lysozyme)
MIIVPIEENKVGIAGLSDARFRAADYGGSGLEAVGAGLAKLGEGAQQFASARDVKRQLESRTIDLGDRHQRNLDDAAAKKAYIAFSNAAAPLLHGDDGILNRVGADAHDVFPDVAAGFADAYDQALAPLDPELRAAVAPALAERVRTYIALSGEHVREQGAVEQHRQSAELQQVAARDAVAHAANPDLHDHYMATGENAIRQQAQIDGVPDEQRDRQIADYVSRTHADTIDALAAHDPVRAAGWYARHGGNLTENDKQRLEAALGAALGEAQATTDVDPGGDLLTVAVNTHVGNKGTPLIRPSSHTIVGSDIAHSHMSGGAPAPAFAPISASYSPTPLRSVADASFTAADLSLASPQPEADFYASAANRANPGAGDSKAGRPGVGATKGVAGVIPLSDSPQRQAANRAQARQDLQDPLVRALMRLIPGMEHADNGYAQLHGTYKEKIADFSRFPSGNAAAGRYQMQEGGMFREGQRHLGISSFTPDDQDMMLAYALRHYKIIDQVKAGDFASANFSLSRFWVSIPVRDKVNAAGKATGVNFEDYKRRFDALYQDELSAAVKRSRTKPGVPKSAPVAQPPLVNGRHSAPAPDNYILGVKSTLP